MQLCKFIAHYARSYEKYYFNGLCAGGFLSLKNVLKTTLEQKILEGRGPPPHSSALKVKRTLLKFYNASSYLSPGLCREYSESDSLNILY